LFGQWCLNRRRFRPQAHKFLTGFAPIRSVVRVGTAAGALLAIPAEQLRGSREAGSGGAAGGNAAGPPRAVPPLSRQIQRSLTGARRCCADSASSPHLICTTVCPLHLSHAREQEHAGVIERVISC
jgi:hypothetical protein